MPQLDIVTFISQIFWLLVFFVILFVFFINNVVPIIAYIQKVRIKKKSFSKSTVQIITKEQKQTLVNYDSIMMKTISHSLSFLLSCNSKINNWLQSQLINISQSNVSSNKAYIASIKQIALQSLFFKKF